MAKYHVNPQTGEVGECSATKRCPFGDLQKDHYPSPAAARETYEASNAGATLAPAVKKAPVKRELPEQTFEWVDSEVLAERAESVHSVELKGAMREVQGVEVGYKYARISFLDDKGKERVVNVLKGEKLPARELLETAKSKAARNEAQKDIRTEEALAAYVSP